MLVFNYLLQSAEKFPDKQAVFHGEKSLTYKEILETAQAQAGWLARQNFGKGFRELF